jgi:NadR type nicotinamide-nucleotide adenylyltransferase
VAEIAAGVAGGGGVTVGLTLGKFAPLHRGHQHLIETALGEVDHLVVIIYDSPEVTAVPLPVRAGWIRELYPAVEVIEAWGGPSELGDDPAVTAAHDAYILGLLGERRVTHFYSSEFYGEHVSRALGAVDRRVDPERGAVPVSGALVRADLYAHRAFVDPRVYRDLVLKVVFFGAPSTGKTTLCQALAAKYDTVWMPEYGREYWEIHQVDRRLTPEQLYEIGIGHREREEAMLQTARGVLFVDTEAIITEHFARYYGDPVDPRLLALARESERRYDACFFCEDDIPYDDTWDRSGAVFRAEFHKQIRADLQVRRIPFVSLRGSVEERVGKVSAVIDRLQPFGSIGDLV